MNNLNDSLAQYSASLQKKILKALNKGHITKKELNDLAAFDGSQGGGHSKLIEATWACKKVGLKREKARRVLEDIYSNSYSSDVTILQVGLVIDKVYLSKTSRSKGSRSKLKESTPKEAKTIIREILAKGGYKELDRGGQDCVGVTPAKYIEEMYEPNDLLCIATAKNKFLTRERDAAIKRVSGGNYPYIVVNPMKKKNGTKPDGRRSERCKDNSCMEGEESLLLYECDLAKGENDPLSAKELGMLATYIIESLPVCSVTHSGSYSLHIAISVKGLNATDIRALKQRLMDIGADKSVLQPWQLSRLANSKRETGEIQKLLYFNPEARGLTPTKEELGKFEVKCDATGEKVKLMEIYHLIDTDKYVRKNALGYYFIDSWGALVRALKHKGMTHTDAVYFLEEAKEYDQVVFCGQIAGRSAGLHVMSGQRLIVRSSPKLIQPKKGEWQMLKSILEELLGEDPDQLATFYGVLQRFLKALHSEVVMPTLVTAICGVPGAGKSFTTDVVIRNLVGGNLTDPTSHLKGGEFNEDVVGSELLVMGDQFSELNRSARKKLGNGLKAFVANGHMSLSAKYKARLSVEPIQAVFMTLNEEKGDVAILPPMNDEGVGEKINLFRANVVDLPMPTDEPEEKEALQEAVVVQLPAFAYFLLHEFEVPNHLKHKRYGVKAYHHAHVLDLLDEMDGRKDVELMIQKALFQGSEADPYVKGSPTELYDRIVDGIFSESGRRSFKNAVGSGSSLGYALRDYKKEKPGMYHNSKESVNGSQQRLWTIHRWSDTFKSLDE